MLERANARLWFSMIAIASAVPAVVFVVSAIWFMRFYFAPPTILAAAPLGPSALAQVEVAVPPPPAAEPVAPLLAAQTPKPLSKMPMLGDAHPAYLRSSAGHFDRCIPGNACQARRSRTLRADRRADPTAQTEAPCHRRSRQPHGAIGAIAHGRK